MNPPKRERAVLVGLYRNREEKEAALESLEELAQLARSAGAAVAGSLLQYKPQPDPAYFIGRGKLLEVREQLTRSGGDVVVFDDDLSLAQARNLEDSLGAKVIDRSELILDIFAQRARSSEGKLQVELAQLEYLLPRLSGKGTLLSRLGGGIGTRGPGETKLEVDRRTIRLRLARIRRELEKLEKRRALQRRKRQSIPVPTVSLVGYTNAGKSTLFSLLTGHTTYVSPRMFATLDPLVRGISLPSGQEILISDTVGFIRKLPHSLVAAFHATLEETLQADLVVHVIDVSRANFQRLRLSVYDVLEEIGLRDTPVLEVYNKVDLIPAVPPVETPYPFAFVSARTGEGLADLLSLIEHTLGRGYRTVYLAVPFERGDIVADLIQRGQVQKTEYGPDGVYLSVALPSDELSRYQRYVRPIPKEGG